MAPEAPAREIVRRHPGEAPLVVTRPVLGPNGLALLQHVLEVLAQHPAAVAAKVEAFAIVSRILAGLLGPAVAPR